ncbi:hypothetical protein [Pseudomonas sp. MYb118]|uniref:hypothetical protein n=1 Tax=Pseudomonas sp. MYb118 TaxID=1848720 RepID=UPI0034CE16AE
MSVITDFPIHGFADPVVDIQTQGSSAPMYSRPTVNCRGRTGEIHALSGVSPWGAMVPQEVLEGGPVFVDALFFGVDVNEIEFQMGDEVRLQGHSLSTGANFELPSKTVTEFSPMHFTLPDVQALQFVGQQLEVIFIIMRNGSALPSLSRFVSFVKALEQTGSISIEGVENGVLEVDKFPHGIVLHIPKIINLGGNNAILMTIRSDLNGGSTAVNLRDYQRQLTVTPEAAIEFRIQPSVYQPYRGEKVFLACSAFLGSGMPQGMLYGLGPRGIIEFQLL